MNIEVIKSPDRHLILVDGSDETKPYLVKLYGECNNLIVANAVIKAIEGVELN